MFLRVFKTISVKTDEIIDTERQAEDPFTPYGMPIRWDKKGKRMHQMGSNPHEDRSLLNGLTQATEISMLKVSKPAVYDA
jgi:hypothetical protein